MRRLCFIFLLCFSTVCFCKDGITFKIEELSKPSKLLKESSPEEVFSKLFQMEVERETLRSGKNHDTHSGIIAQSHLPRNLFGKALYNPFFDGMYYAYADHRPFVISPDVVWMVICRGFSMHVNANAELFRSRFVGFPGKLTLALDVGLVVLENPNTDWNSIISRSVQQMTEYTGNELITTLTADFSTTTPTEKMASEVLIMHAMRNYFEPMLSATSCGIPEVTLQGTPEDWQRILDKTRQLAKYDLEWWTKELEPILHEFVETSKGNIDINFWKGMFKIHTPQFCGPDVIDGWVMKFYPYDYDGERTGLTKSFGMPSLPAEIISVDLLFVDGRTNTITPLELWSGIVGLEQNKETFALTPRIGWMLRKADSANDGEINDDNPVTLRVYEVPAVLCGFQKIDNLKIEFVDHIKIPDELAGVSIRKLTLIRKTDKKEIQRIKRLFPNTQLDIQNTLDEAAPTADKIERN